MLIANIYKNKKNAILNVLLIIQGCRMNNARKNSFGCGPRASNRESLAYVLALL